MIKSGRGSCMVFGIMNMMPPRFTLPCDLCITSILMPDDCFRQTVPLIRSCYEI